MDESKTWDFCSAVIVDIKGAKLTFRYIAIWTPERDCSLRCLRGNGSVLLYITGRETGKGVFGGKVRELQRTDFDAGDERVVSLPALGCGTIGFRGFCRYRLAQIGASPHSLSLLGILLLSRTLSWTRLKNSRRHVLLLMLSPPAFTLLDFLKALRGWCTLDKASLLIQTS